MSCWFQEVRLINRWWSLRTGIIITGRLIFMIRVWKSQLLKMKSRLRLSMKSRKLRVFLKLWRETRNRFQKRFIKLKRKSRMLKKWLIGRFQEVKTQRLLLWNLVDRTKPVPAKSRTNQLSSRSIKIINQLWQKIKWPTCLQLVTPSLFLLQSSTSTLWNLRSRKGLR